VFSAKYLPEFVQLSLHCYSVAPCSVKNSVYHSPRKIGKASFYQMHSNIRIYSVWFSAD